MGRARHGGEHHPRRPRPHPERPAGTKGISCFIVPKFLVNADGSLGERNDYACLSIEHKVGIHSSPTCMLSFGDAGKGAVGYLIGEENQGMRYMFTMMNEARLSVGTEGLGGERTVVSGGRRLCAQRKQGRTVGGDRGEQAPIIDHPDVRRMLMMMRANIEAMRGVLYRNALALDLALPRRRGSAMQEESLAAILTPISKAWATDLGVELTSLGIQIHGGSGYIEETGVAQFWRDSRIAPIYEGTNGIQAQDLAMRRIPLEGGNAIRRLFETVLADAASLDGDLKPIGERLTAAAEASAQVAMTFGAWLAEARYNDVLAGATPFLKMMGDTLGGWIHARAARAAVAEPAGYDPAFLADRIATAAFYAEHVLSTVPGLTATSLAGAEGLFAIDEARFS